MANEFVLITRQRKRIIFCAKCPSTPTTSVEPPGLIDFLTARQAFDRGWDLEPAPDNTLQWLCPECSNSQYNVKHGLPEKAGGNYEN
jgi:hypothetical protein